MMLLPVRQGVIEPAVQAMAASNQKIQKQMLKLLAKEDRRLQEERKFHERSGTVFVPTALQQRNQQLWEEAKEKMPEAVAEAVDTKQSTSKRERFSDHLRLQMETQQKLIEQYTQPSAVDTALLAIIERIAAPPQPQLLPPPEASQPTLTNKKARLDDLKELLNDGTITPEEYSAARMHILQS
jgi:hypothetical protein